MWNMQYFFRSMSMPSNEMKLGDGNYFDHGDGFKEKKIWTDSQRKWYDWISHEKHHEAVHKKNPARTLKILLKTCNTFRVCVWKWNGWLYIVLMMIDMNWSRSFTRKENMQCWTKPEKNLFLLNMNMIVWWFYSSIAFTYFRLWFWWKIGCSNSPLVSFIWILHFLG